MTAYCEQQFPNDDPVQVKPFGPPHVASVETFLLGGEGEGDERIDEGATGVELAFIESVDGVGDGVTRLDDDGALPLVHVPKADWQPVPQ